MYYLFLTHIFDGQLDYAKFCKEHDFNPKILQFDIFMLKLTGALRQDKNNLILSEFGRYLMMVLMKEFYIGMDKLRAFFRENKMSNGTFNIMRQN